MMPRDISSGHQSHQRRRRDYRAASMADEHYADIFRHFLVCAMLQAFAIFASKAASIFSCDAFIVVERNIEIAE
jgi:hypothetical protein